MANVASKNLFDILGNDHDEDSDKEPEEPTRAVEKTLPRTTKRNAADTPPTTQHTQAAGERGGRGGRGAGAGGNEDAFRDRAAGAAANRGRFVDDGLRQDRHPDHLAGSRGGRGGRGRRGNRDDRHSRTGRTDTEKEVAQGWGSQKGEAEWSDEKAGEAIAQAEEKEGGFGAAVEEPVDAEGNHPAGDEETKAAAPEPEPEPEDNTKSYADYLAEQAAKKLDLGTPEARKPNENVKPDKKWAQAKELKRDDEEDDFIAGSGPKSKRERQRKEKTFVDIEHRSVEPQRGGREGGRGGRGRGEGRGEYRGRGRGEGRGSYRGRGGRGGDAVNVADTTAFPTLGGSK